MNEINLFSPEFNYFYAKYANDIGKGELFIKADEVWPVATKVGLNFTLVHDDLVFLSLPGTVMEMVGDEENPIGMKIRLDDRSDNVRSFIVEIVKWQMKNELKKMYIP